MSSRFLLERLSRMAAVLVLFACGITAQVRICPLGDSIIESYTGRASARYYLDQLLQNDGYAFDFVGHNHGVYGGPPLYANFDQDHEAYSGWQVNMVLLDLRMWIQETRPDIVLIHLGTNDLIRHQSASSTVAELGQCIDVIRSVNPRATVLISQITPMGTRAVEPLNSLIPGMVASKDTALSRVVVVDHYTPFDLFTHMQLDFVHLNDAGEQLMAQIWYDALRDFMTPAAQEPSLFGAGCTGSADEAPVIDWIHGQAASLGNPFTVEIDHAPPGASAFAILGFDPVSYYGTPLPIDLSLLGAAGCSILVGPDLTLPLTNLGGKSAWTLEVPDNPLLVGGLFYQQAAFLQPGLNALGLIFSNAAAVTVVEGS